MAALCGAGLAALRGFKPGAPVHARVTLAEKLNLEDGQLRIIGKPAELDLDVPATDGEGAGVLVFVRNLSEVGVKCLPMVEAAKRDKLAWLAYPENGKLGTDLNRDILRNHMARQGIKGVGQVAINDVWSAMRFRSHKEEA